MFDVVLDPPLRTIQDKWRKKKETPKNKGHTDKDAEGDPSHSKGGF